MPHSTARPLRVFPCHGSQDKPIVRELRNRLASEGWIDPWLDEEKIALGQRWTTVIENALDSSDVIIIFLSKNSVQKEGFIQRELNYAWELSLEKPHNVILLIPFQLDDCEVPRHLRSRHWGDYFGERKETTYKNLIEALKQRHQQKLQLEVKKRVKQEAKNVSRKSNEKKVSKFLEEHVWNQGLFLQNLSHVHVRGTQLPSLNILLADENTRLAERMINRTAAMIEKTLAEFGIFAIVIGFRTFYRNQLRMIHQTRKVRILNKPEVQTSI